jgi:hypothetical protein
MRSTIGKRAATMDNAEPMRFNVADIQTQMTLGGGVLKGGILVVDPNGLLVAYGHYAKLKAEVERLRFAEDFIKDENKHLREEEPLPDGWNSAVAKACDLIAEKDKEIARLRKSGDQMATVLSDLLQSDLIPCSISRGVIKSTLDKWNAAPK